MHHILSRNEALLIAQQFTNNILIFREVDALEYAYWVSIGIAELGLVDKQKVESVYQELKSHFTAVA